MVNGEGLRKGLVFMPTIVKKIICKIKGHSNIRAGSCPFTGKTYDVCSRCQVLKMV